MNRKIILTSGILVVVILATLSGIWVLYQKNEEGCIAIAVPMRNIENGECNVFPSPCDIPKSGWIKDDDCMNLEAIDTSQWKSYKNEEYKFELKYPNEFLKQNVTSRDALISLQKHEEGSLHVITIAMKKNYQLDEDKYERLDIDDRVANKYFFQEGDGYSGVFQIQVNNDTLNILYDMIGHSNKEFVKNELDGIISTFYFIDDE